MAPATAPQEAGGRGFGFGGSQSRILDSAGAACYSSTPPTTTHPNETLSMFDTTPFADLAKRLAESVPADFNNLRDDMEKNFHAILQASFSRMNLVSREEFEVQTALLARTREHLEQLETRVAELEQRILKP